jgi:hypothetical protein
LVELPDEASVGMLVRGLVHRGCEVRALEPTADAIEEAFRHAVLGHRPGTGES